MPLSIAPNSIVQSDCLDYMSYLSDESIDLIVTSPPYNIRNSTGNGMKYESKKGMWKPALANGGYGNYDDNMPYDEYVMWQRECIDQMLRVLKPHGAIFYNHKWRVQNGLWQDRQSIVDGFPVRQIIIWHRKGGVNFNEQYFLPTYEVIYLIAKPEFRLNKQSYVRGDVWEITQDRNTGHPASFPLALADICVSSSQNTSLVFDPFCGSGTTLLAAAQRGIDYLGCDINPDYIALSNKRVSTYTKRMF